MKIKPLFLAIFTISVSSAESSLYHVKKGDTLSEIVEKRTERLAPLYGEGGRLETVLKLNPNIQNPNLIEIGERILLEASNFDDVKAKQNIKTSKDKEVSSPKTGQDTPTAPTYFYAGIGAGAIAYADHQQSEFGNATVTGLSLDNLKLFAGFKRKTYELQTDFNSFSYRYDVEGNSSKKRLFSAQTKLFYHNIFIAYSLEQYALYRKLNSKIEMTAESANFLGLGYRWKYRLKEYRDVILHTSFSIDKHLSASSKEASVKAIASDSLGAQAQADLRKQFEGREDYFYWWSNRARWRQIKRDIKWDGVEDSVNSSALQFETSIGLGVSF